jgi:hypothetical protein
MRRGMRSGGRNGGQSIRNVFALFFKMAAVGLGFLILFALAHPFIAVVLAAFIAAVIMAYKQGAPPVRKVRRRAVWQGVK